MKSYYRSSVVKRTPTPTRPVRATITGLSAKYIRREAEATGLTPTAIVQHMIARYISILKEEAKK